MYRIYKYICMAVAYTILLFNVMNIGLAYDSDGIKQTLMNLAITSNDATMTDVDIDNIMESLSYALEELGVDPNSINMYRDTGQSVNVDTDLSWNDEFMSYNSGSTQYNVDGIGDFALYNEGSSLALLGNQCLQGKNAIYSIPVSDSKQTFTYDYKLDFGDSFNAAGLLVRVARNEDTLSGYMISINNNKWQDWCGGAAGALWRFTFTKGTNMTPFQLNGDYGTSIELVKPLNINTEGTLTVSADKKYITVSGGGLPEADVTAIHYKIDTDNDGKLDTTVYNEGTGFGLFSDHYNHNCEKIGEFELNNIKSQHESTNYFSDLINNLQWKADGSLNLIIDINKYKDTDLSDPSKLGEMLAKCLNEDIHYLSWGPEESKIGTEAFIVNNDSNGMFTPFDGTKTSYDNSIDKTAKYIKDVLDIEGSGRSGLNTSGNKVIVINDASNNKIEASGMPEASFKPNIDGTNINFTSKSHSNDGNNKNVGFGNGIAEEKWKYKDITDGKAGEWKEGLPGKIDNQDYLVSLEVKDFKGNWSEPCIQNISAKDTSRPVADFSNTGENKSFSPNGSDIVKYDWEIKKDGEHLGIVSNNSYSIPDFSGRHGKGDYEYTLQVTDSNGLKSSPVTKVINPEIFKEPTQINRSKTIWDRLNELEKWQRNLLITLYLAIFALSLVLGYEILAYFLI